ncbi:MAG: hypothetical protein B6244_09685 [Candidatus Cloacimonetes bacterium 4572_55]|nr:MAG: hypothetical protein B6244_09685 [Candidatus Cloacimonetes bacterium 4572_55]
MEFDKRARKKATINVTSLIDVLFLLLIFFMVSSTFKEQPGMKLELPSAKSSDMLAAEELSLFVSKEQKLFLNDQPIDEERLKAQLQQHALQDDPPPLILQADTGVAHGYIVHLMDLARNENIRKITIATQIPEGK